jgi:hypothetical protein
MHVRAPLLPLLVQFGEPGEMSTTVDPFEVDEPCG